jgi:hypothetical protein
MSDLYYPDRQLVIFYGVNDAVVSLRIRYRSCPESFSLSCGLGGSAREATFAMILFRSCLGISSSSLAADLLKNRLYAPSARKILKNIRKRDDRLFGALFKSCQLGGVFGKR